MEFVDVSTARARRGLALVVAEVIPSPWSEAAKGLVHVKGLSAVGVRAKWGDAEHVAWTGIQNVPVAMYEDEVPRSGWAEILALTERLGGAVSLVPDDPAERIRFFGLMHELAGEDGLGWCNRLLMIHGALESGGARSFALPAATHLAKRYGYSREAIPATRARIAEILAGLAALLSTSRAAGHTYLLGERLSALDIYAATFLTPVLCVPEVDCPAMRAAARPGFTYLREELAASVPSALVEHRTRMFEKHLPWPIVL